MRYDNKTFSHQRVELDGNQFYGCTFLDCTLVFNAYAPVSIERCKFDDCDWVFDGSADIMLSFLTALNRGLGESGEHLVGLIFKGIQDGKFVEHPPVPRAVAS